MSKLTNVVIQEFLSSFEEKAETTILETGKEKNELEQIAKARGINIKKSRDLAIFKTKYAFTDVANSNGAILPKKDLLKVLPGIIGKPINKNHDRDRVMGFYIDYRYLEKSSTIIAYGIFFKSYFPTEWEAAQSLFKKKKLSTSFEIWSPEEKRTKREDGSYELHQMEIGGGALIFEDDENIPSFKDAKVLALAKEEVEKAELVYASKYKESEMITSKIAVEKSDEQVERKDEKTSRFITKKELLNQTEESPIQPIIVKTHCSNCSEEFEISGYDSNIKCPKCFAILNQKGTMIYPPQIKDFKLLCPSCKVDNWLILSNKEKTSQIRCMNCAKEYDIGFKKEQSNKALDKLTFLYTGTAYCIQCGNGIVFEGSSKQKQREFNCPKCGLTFTHNTSKRDINRTIATIQEREVKSEQELIKSKEKGGKTMEQKDEAKITEPTVKKVEEKVVEPKVEEVKKELVVEPKATETPADESSKEEKAPEAVVEKVEEKPAEEVKADVVEEVKEAVVEEVKTEETIDADVEYEKTFETTQEDVNELTISKVVAFAKLNDRSDLETAKDRKSLTDSEFAIVVKIKNKKTGKERTIRRYPINDKAQIRNTLSKLSKPEAQATLTKLGANMDSINRKILVQAKKIIKASLLEKRKAKKSNTEKKIATYKAGIKKVVTQLIEAKKQVELYKTDAKAIISRRSELEEFASELKDVDLLNDDKFERAKLEKAQALQKASETKEDDIVGDSARDDDYYSKKRNEIDALAFKAHKRN